MKQVCSACGRRAQRDCPALDGPICSACCGDKRGSAIACAATCPYFPFGTAAIETFRELDAEMIQKLALVVAKEIGAREMEDALRACAASAEGPDGEPRTDLFQSASSVALLKLFHQPGPDGRTVYAGLEKGEFPGFSNDERVHLRYLRSARPTVIEIQRILDERYLEIIDLFEPDTPRERLLDPTVIERRPARFTRILLWLAQYPHFARGNGVCLELPDLITTDYVQRIRALALEAGIGDPREYIIDHMFECQRLMFTMGQERGESILRASDLRSCAAAYTIVGDWTEVRAILESKPELERVEEAPAGEAIEYRWTRRGESQRIERRIPGAFRSDEDEGIVGGLGTLRLSPDELTVEALSKQKFDFARRLLKKWLGDSVQPQRGMTRNLGKEMAMRLKDGASNMLPDAPAAPAREIDPETQRVLIEQFLTRQYESFADEPVPMLDGLTPREASGRPEMRGKLVELMKLHLHGLESDYRPQGVNISLDALLDELGLGELK